MFIRVSIVEDDSLIRQSLAKVIGSSSRFECVGLYGSAEEALAYNALVVAWPEIMRLASQNPSGTEPQTTMDF